MDKALTVGSLFSGIGGLDLGLERAGMRVIWQSEIDPYASRVLQKHWPEVPNYGDIKKIQWADVVRPNVICGGYPCQPFSTAGKRRGEEDPRHLWPWVRNAISELRPDYAILENVRGHLSLGGATVIGELAAIGYDAEWRIVSAASVGANHRRDRLIIVAYPNNSGSRTPKRGMGTGRHETTTQSKNRAPWTLNGVSGRGANVANTTSARLERAVGSNNQGNRIGFTGGGEQMANADGEQLGQRRLAQNLRQANSSGVYHGSRQTGYDGWKWWATEPNVGRVANGVPARVDRLRGLGNAVVPQVAEVIGRLVLEHWRATND